MKAVVLLSGGLDSTTALAVARSQGFECYALSVDYGQRHRVERAALAVTGRMVDSRGADRLGRHVVHRPGCKQQGKPRRGSFLRGSAGEGDDSGLQDAGVTLLAGTVERGQASRNSAKEANAFPPLVFGMMLNSSTVTAGSST